MKLGVRLEGHATVHRFDFCFECFGIDGCVHDDLLGSVVLGAASAAVVPSGKVGNFARIVGGSGPIMRTKT
jgi:hypothetical protein